MFSLNRLKDVRWPCVHLRTIFLGKMFHRKKKYDNDDYYDNENDWIFWVFGRDVVNELKKTFLFNQNSFCRSVCHESLVYAQTISIVILLNDSIIFSLYWHSTRNASIMISCYSLYHQSTLLLIMMNGVMAQSIKLVKILYWKWRRLTHETVNKKCVHIT